jgi:hypothetical protein
MYLGFTQNAILPAETHPDDVARLLAAKVPGPFGGPMLAELPEAVKEASSQ